MISIQQVGKEAIIRTRDNGPGIAEEDRKRLFDAFYRVDDQTTRSESGTGLGLGVARSLVELHGGKIWIQSEIGVGTEVGFSLPVGGSVDGGSQGDCGGTTPDLRLQEMTNRLGAAE